MAGTFGDLIWQMAGNQDPTMAMLAALQGGQGTQPPALGTQPGAGTDPAAAGAVPTPQPQAYRSPPDLMQMYGELQKQRAFADSMNTGLGLILSGFAKPENKENIMSAFGGGGGSDSLAGGGGSDPLSFMTNVLKFQEAQQQLNRQQADRANLPTIAKTYGLDEKTANYLFNTGKLDAVIAELEKPNKQLTKDENGQSYIVDLTTGEVSEPFGTKKPQEVEIVTDENTGRKFAVDKVTKKPIGGPDLVPGQRKTEYIKQGDGSQVLVYSDTKEPVAGGDPLTSVQAPPRGTEYVEMADGSKILVYSDTKEPVQDPEALKMVSAPPKKVQFIDDGRGGKKAVYEDGTPVPDKDIPGLGSTEREQLYNAALADHVKRGGSATEFPSLDDWLKEQAKAGATQVNMGPTGVDYGDPPTDMAWKRDKEGKVLTDENGAPMAVPIQGSKLWAESQKTAKKGEAADLNAIGSNLVVGQDIDRAIDNIVEGRKSMIGTTGWGSLLDFMPNSPQRQLDDLIHTVKANVSKDQLQAMRASNETGAALGNISDFENRLMQATLGSLDTAGDDKDLVYNLRRIKALYAAIITRGVKDQGEADSILNSVKYPTDEELDKMEPQFHGNQPPPAEDEDIDAIIERNLGNGKSR